MCDYIVCLITLEGNSYKVKFDGNEVVEIKKWGFGVFVIDPRGLLQMLHFPTFYSSSESSQFIKDPSIWVSRTTFFA
jgi:hypothetical protein